MIVSGKASDNDGSVVEDFIAHVLFPLKLDLAVLEPHVAELVLNSLNLLGGAELNPGKSGSLFIQRHLYLGFQDLHSLVLAEFKDLLLGDGVRKVEKHELVGLYQLRII